MEGVFISVYCRIFEITLCRFLIYKTETEDVSVDALIRDDTIWLTQKAMAELLAIDKSGISRHLKNIFESGELDEEVVDAKIAILTKHGAIPEKEQLSPTNYYSYMKLFEKSNCYGKHISISRFSHNQIAVSQHYRNGGRSDVLCQTEGKYYVALVLGVGFKKCIQCYIIEHSNWISRHP